MQISLPAAEAALARRLTDLKIADAGDVAWAALWLEACGYSGIKLLAEALTDERRELPLVRDALGIDLHNVSCAFLAPAIMRDVAAHGRAFLRNVRHGLFLLPFTVHANIGIGCPVDPSFAVGGERHKNPYGEKLVAAAEHGLAVEDSLWAQIGAAH